MSEQTHRCHFPGCKEPTPRNRLFCKPHWFMVPAAIRDRVWAAYLKLPHGPAGNCLRISNEWLQAVSDAEEAIKAELPATKPMFTRYPKCSRVASVDNDGRINPHYGADNCTGVGLLATQGTSP